jgi:hypothetical protein
LTATGGPLERESKQYCKDEVPDALFLSLSTSATGDSFYVNLVTKKLNTICGDLAHNTSLTQTDDQHDTRTRYSLSNK